MNHEIMNYEKKQFCKVIRIMRVHDSSSTAL